MKSANLQPLRRRTTIDLPVALSEEIQQALQRGLARSQNSLIVQAIESYLEQTQEAWIDAQFAQMAQDQETQTSHLRIAESFEQADWEALQIRETEQ